MGDFGSSSSMTVLVVDDESLARRNVTVLLRFDPDIGSVVECESGMAGAHEVVLKSKARLPLSRRFSKQFRDRMSGKARREPLS